MPIDIKAAQERVFSETRQAISDNDPVLAFLSIANIAGEHFTEEVRTAAAEVLEDEKRERARLSKEVNELREEVRALTAEIKALTSENVDTPGPLFVLRKMAAYIYQELKRAGKVS